MGIEAIKRIRTKVPESKVVAYKMYDGEEFVEGALRVSARGYVLKSSSLRALVRAIKRVQCNKIFLDRGISDTAFLRETSGGNLNREDQGCKTEEPQKNELTIREKEVLKSLVDGMTAKEIAARLSISSNTMRPHIRHIYVKLGVNTREAFVAKALNREIGLSYSGLGFFRLDCT